MPIGEKLIQDGKALSFVNNAAGEDARLAHFLMEGFWTNSANSNLGIAARRFPCSIAAKTTIAL